MRTVKEVSKLTGISVRALHYYDEIGLLKPSGCTEAGYRLYDDRVLERLRQILFFREFDVPLKEIRTILENPDLDRDKILRMQREMLVQKRKRLDRLIGSIDRMLKGENDMDFGVFSKSELEAMCDHMLAKADGEQRKLLIEPYGGEEGFRRHFMENAGSEQAQKNFAKVAEWYGDKESAQRAATGETKTSQVFAAYQKRLDAIMKNLADRKGADVQSFEVKSLVGEYDFVMKQMFQMEDVSRMVLDMAQHYRTNAQVIAAQDAVYGEGATVYIARALEAFYGQR